MITRAVFLLSVSVLSLTANASFGAISPLDADTGNPRIGTFEDMPPSAGSKPPAARTAKPSAPAAERVPIGNPLWAIPLKSLPITRDRPVFSPSRRPPPPAVAGVPAPAPVAPRAAKPAEADRPQLLLVGTIKSELEGIGVFIDQTTKKALRLKTGEGHQGWVLRMVRGREATLQKGHQTAVVTLPPPGGEQKPGKSQLSEATQPNATPPQSEFRSPVPSGATPKPQPPVLQSSEPSRMPQGFSSPLGQTQPTSSFPSSTFPKPPTFDGKQFKR